MNSMTELFIYAFVLCNIYGIKGLDQKHVIKKSLNACQKCKLVTDSFQYWLDKTSRGKYDGGDVAWEETKLRSYSKSEIRLTEVQEGLCSEIKKHKSDCYTLAEESESLLEMWWSLDNTNQTDFFLWLCTERLQYCCPEGHFGAKCDPCPLGKNNEICTGHGICIGDGTRHGNGTCLCLNGYTGYLCDNCAYNTYNLYPKCIPCHKACDGCVGNGADNCKACQTGWYMDHNICVDVDECMDSFNCKQNEYCLNIEGSYTCNMCHTSCKTCKGESSENCTSCNDNFVLWSGTCVNDELKSKILHSSLKRLGLYSGLLIIAYFVMHYSRILSILTIFVISIYIYHSEKSYDIDIATVFIHLYLS